MYGLSGLDVPQNLEIVVTTPDYFQRLDALLQNTSQEYVIISVDNRYSNFCMGHFRGSFMPFKSCYHILSNHSAMVL